MEIRSKNRRRQTSQRKKPENLNDEYESDTEEQILSITQRFTYNMATVKNITVLNLSDCSALKEITLDALNEMEGLTLLNIKNCVNLTNLQATLKHTRAFLLYH